MNYLIFFLGRLISSLSTTFNLGNGSTWPGHIALKLNKNFIKEIVKSSNLKIIFVIGTNGKTTTSKLIQTVLGENGLNVLTNSSGANLLNGVASSLILNRNLLKENKKNFAILEIDENAFPNISKEIEPDYVIALNLFRDQLDRYGEIDTIIKKWKKTIQNFQKTTLILNADDPQIAYLGYKFDLKKYFFGLEDKSLEKKEIQHGADSVLCPNCSFKLTFSAHYFSHLGKWACDKCKYKRENPDLSKFPYYPLEGTYSIYDTLACVILAKDLGIKDKDIQHALKNFVPAFGRQEEIIYGNQKIKIILSKNPISFNESLDTVKKLGGKNMIFALNDRIPDGLDVSWIWDIDFENILEKDMNIYIFGDRASDMSLRLKYADHFNQIIENLEDGIKKISNGLEKNETLYILPNYSAMLDIRKNITGKKIL